MSRPQVVAHRGSSHANAEHTLGAYLAALEEGSEALECDVRLTADGHLVCAHDRDLRRTAQHRGVISTMTLDELDHLDVSSWKNPWRDLDDEAEERRPELDSVLSLRRLLEVVAEHERPVEVAIETKHPTRYAGLVERRLAELLAEFGWTGADAPVRVMSFSWVALSRMRRLTPSIPVVYCMEKRRTWALAESVVEGDWIAGPGLELLRREPTLRAAARSGARDLHVWTVNHVEDLEWCANLGVRAIITDKPVEMIRYRNENIDE